MIDNLPLRTHHHRGLTIEGYSRAAVQTYWRIPELKIGFDLGGQTIKAVLVSPSGVLLDQASLPSGGDTSYPGMVLHGGLLWMSYYSSHEDGTNIYMTKVRL